MNASKNIDETNVLFLLKYLTSLYFVTKTKAKYLIILRMAECYPNCWNSYFIVQNKKKASNDEKKNLSIFFTF